MPLLGRNVCEVGNWWDAFYFRLAMPGLDTCQAWELVELVGIGVSFQVSSLHLLLGAPISGVTCYIVNAIS